MLHEDYLVREFRRMLMLLARVLGLLKEERVVEAGQALDAAYRELGLDRELVNRLDVASLAGVLSRPDRVLLAARLLGTEAAWCQAQGMVQEATVKRRRALQLYATQGDLGPEDEEFVRELKALLPR